MGKMDEYTRGRADGMATWVDYIETIREELGIEMTIRPND